MPSTTTLPTFGTTAAAPASAGANTETNAATPPTAALTQKGTQAPTQPTINPLKPTLAGAKFAPTGAKAKAKPAAKAKGKGAKGPAGAEIPAGAAGAGQRVGTRTAALELIASMRHEPTPTHTETEQQGLLTRVAEFVTGSTKVGNKLTGTHGSFTQSTVNVPESGTRTTSRGKGTVLVTDTLKATINTVARHALGKPHFTITTANFTPKQWDQIRSEAEAKLHERQIVAGEQESARKESTLAQGQTTTLTGQQLYTHFIKTYNTVTDTKDSATKGKSFGQIFAAAAVKMGLLDAANIATENPQAVEAAYQQVMGMAQQTDETAKAAIQHQVAKYAPTWAHAEEGTGTPSHGQPLATYYKTLFTTIAHQYLVPVTAHFINQHAATAQAAGTGATGFTLSQAKENLRSEFEETIRKQAESLYPTFADTLAKGKTTQQLLNPYAAVAATALGYKTATTTAMAALGITWMQPKWQPALSGGKTATGKPAPMSMTQWRQHIVSTPQYGWQNTAPAKQLDLNVGQQLAQSLGIRKY